MVLVLVLSILAGALTTISGMGGGLILVLGLSFAYTPLIALAASGPALLVGNLHRAIAYRRVIDRPRALRYVLGAAPGALAGGLIAVSIPTLFLHVGLITLSLLAAGRVLFAWRVTPPAAALVPGGAAVGFVAATAGGGGLIAGPMLLASGLSGRPYVATAAVGAVAVHVFRLLGYGVGGMLNGNVLLMGLVGSVGIAIGNLVGDRVARALPEAVVPRVEIGVVLACVGLAVVGVA